MGPALLFVAVFVLLPLGQLIATSLTDKSLLGGGKFVGDQNYLRIWRDAGFWRALEFTVKYTIILTPILMGLGYAIALLTVENTKLKRLTRTIVFLPVVIGLSSSSLLWYWLLDEQVGLFNKVLVDFHIIKEPIVWFITADLAFWAVVISVTWKVVGFGMVLFVSGIQSINPDILEAAVMDGAGYGSRVRRIILPLTRRILLLTTLVSAIGSMLAFDQFYIMTSGGAARRNFHLRVWDLSEFVCFVQTRLRLGAVGRADGDHSRLRRVADRADRAERSDMSAPALTTQLTFVQSGKRARPSVYLAAAACVAIIAIMAAPLVFSFLASIRTAAEAAAAPPHYWPQTLSPENYLKVIGYQAGLATYLGNSALVALMTIAACILLAAPAGYGLARFSPRGKEVAFLFLLAPMMIPYQALLTPLYLDFAKFGLVNSRVGLAIVHTILQLPFSVYLMRNSFEAIPARDRRGGDGRRLLGVAAADVCLSAARPSRARHGRAVRVPHLLERIPRRAHFHEPRILVHRAHSPGQRAHRRSRRHRLGSAPGKHHHFDHPLSRHLFGLAALLCLGPALGRRQMSDFLSEDEPPSPDETLAPGARTLRDVARLAGVSIGTASKALNANGRLSAETRAKVLSVAKAIDYRPNDLAQSLHRARSMTVGLLSTDNFGRFTFPIAEALERRLFDHGIAVFMCNATDDPLRERRHVDQLLGKRVDGLVVTARRADRRAPVEIAQRGLPVVYVFSQVENPDAHCLLPDDEGGAKLAVSHLVALGRRRIAHITGPESFEAVRLREKGFRAALEEAGFSARASDCRAGRWSEAWGREAAQLLFSRRRLAPDALFCGNDQIARGALDALREMGRAVPDDVAVVGFDNWNVMTEASRPPLTSIDMNLGALGSEAGAALLEMMSGRTLAGVRRLPCTLVVRGFVRRARRVSDQEREMTERSFSPLPFAEVAMTGAFWRERLDTVLIPHDSEPARQARGGRDPRVR